MDATAHIAKWLIGGLIAVVAYWLLFGLLVEWPGYFIYSLFVETETDPDNRHTVDPTGRKSVAVGLAFWTVLCGIGYAVYHFTRTPV